jgi:hypothetical protein
MNVGTRVRIERDETRYPSRGTWPRFRGKTGTIVEINLGEYGVVFGKAYERSDRPGVYRYHEPPTWFQPYELRTLARGLGRDSERTLTPTRTDGEGKGQFDRAVSDAPKVVAHV